MQIFNGLLNGAEFISFCLETVLFRYFGVNLRI
jgi:hypothetical protein